MGMGEGEEEGRRSEAGEALLYYPGGRCVAGVLAVHRHGAAPGAWCGIGCETVIAGTSQLRGFVARCRFRIAGSVACAGMRRVCVGKCTPRVLGRDHDSGFDGVPVGDAMSRSRNPGLFLEIQDPGIGVPSVTYTGASACLALWTPPTYTAPAPTAGSLRLSLVPSAHPTSNRMAADSVPSTLAHQHEKHIHQSQVSK